jgi:hypothetical protein
MVLRAQVVVALFASPALAHSRPGVEPKDAWTCPVTHPIKGNFTTYSGERCIFHVRGGKFYEKTKLWQRLLGRPVSESGRVGAGPVCAQVVPNSGAFLIIPARSSARGRRNPPVPHQTVTRTYTTRGIGLKILVSAVQSRPCPPRSPFGRPSPSRTRGSSARSRTRAGSSRLPASTSPSS